MATEMLHAGIPLVVVSRRLDHQRPSTTLNHYAHAVPGGDAQASATLRQIMQTRPRFPNKTTTACSAAAHNAGSVRVLGARVDRYEPIA